MKSTYLRSLTLGENCIADLIQADGEPFDIPNPHWMISRIHTTLKGRNQGLGKLVMVDICHDADLEGVTLSLAPAPYDGGEFDKLVDFYKKFGFRWASASQNIMVRSFVPWFRYYRG